MSCVFRCTAATSLFENPSLLERDERAGDVERDFAVGGHLLRSNQDSMASTEPRVISLDHLLLRGERQLPKSAARSGAGEAVLVQVALSSEPEEASQLGAVHGFAS